MRSILLIIFISIQTALFSQSIAVTPATSVEVTHPFNPNFSSYPIEHFKVHNNGSTAINLAYTVQYSNLNQLNWIASSCCFFLNQGDYMSVANILPNDSFDFTVQILTAPIIGTGELKILLHEDGDTSNGVLVHYKAHIVDNISVTELSTSQYSVYPNPANDFLTIEGADLNGSLEIYDIKGKLHLRIPFENTINVSNLAKGVYFIHLLNSNNNRVIRFIKE